MPAYYNTPNAADRISATQAPIQTNFVSLDASFSENHEPVATGGKHIKIDINNIGAEPTAAAATSLVAYNFLNPNSTNQELYVRRNGEAGVPMTARDYAANQGWFYLPSGLLVKYGTASWLVAAPGNNFYDYPAAGTEPVFGAVHMCNLTVIKAAATFYDAAIQLGSLTPTRINYAISKISAIGTYPDANVPFHYYSVGTPA